jgi:signal peptidase I
MLVRATRVARRSLTVAWIGCLIGIVSVVVLGHLAPSLGREVFIIRGGSMEPTIPLGSLVLVDPVPADTIKGGDVVSVRIPTGVVVTHRVVNVVTTGDGERYWELKGDANPATDGGLAPAEWGVGRVVAHVPFAGYLLAMLSTPAGMVSVMSALGWLMTAAWLVEAVEKALRRRESGREPVLAPV